MSKEKEQAKDPVFEGVSYNAAKVAGMTQEAFIEQSKGQTFKGHGNQMEKLKALHAEATRVNKEQTAKTPPPPPVK